MYELSKAEKDIIKRTGGIPVNIKKTDFIYEDKKVGRYRGGRFTDKRGRFISKKEVGEYHKMYGARNGLYTVARHYFKRDDPFTGERVETPEQALKTAERYIVKRQELEERYRRENRPFPEYQSKRDMLYRYDGVES